MIDIHVNLIDVKRFSKKKIAKKGKIQRA
jgi:hypothetical protein